MSRENLHSARPVQSVDVTTIWRDGQVVRRDWRGQWQVRPSCPPIDALTPEFAPAAMDAEVYL